MERKRSREKERKNDNVMQISREIPRWKEDKIYFKKVRSSDMYTSQ